MQGKSGESSAGLLAFIKYVSHSIAVTLAGLLKWQCHWNSPALCYYACDYHDIFAKLSASLLKFFWCCQSYGSMCVQKKLCCHILGTQNKKGLFMLRTLYKLSVRLGNLVYQIVFRVIYSHSRYNQRDYGMTGGTKDHELLLHPKIFSWQTYI